MQSTWAAFPSTASEKVQRELSNLKSLCPGERLPDSPVGGVGSSDAGVGSHGRQGLCSVTAGTSGLSWGPFPHTHPHRRGGAAIRHSGIPERSEPRLAPLCLVTTPLRALVSLSALNPQGLTSETGAEGGPRALERRTGAQRPGQPARRSRALMGSWWAHLPWASVEGPLSPWVPPIFHLSPQSFQGPQVDRWAGLGGWSRAGGSVGHAPGAAWRPVGQQGRRTQWGLSAASGPHSSLLFPLSGAAWSAGAEGSPGPSRASCKSCHLLSCLSPLLPLEPRARRCLMALTDRQAHLPRARGRGQRALRLTRESGLAAHVGLQVEAQGPLALLLSPLMHTVRCHSDPDTTLPSCLKVLPAASGKFWKEVEVRGSQVALSRVGVFTGAGRGLCTLLSPQALLPQNSGLPHTVGGLAAPLTPR